MNKLFKEPLFYFLLLGGVLFGLFRIVSGDPNADTNVRDEIVVSPGRIQMLAVSFERTWQRPPSQMEMDGLIDGFIREEILYREALAMGLDRDDPIVRRRMNQKIEFLSEDLVGLEEPEEAELQAYLEANPEPYRQASRFSFKQIYLNPANYDQDRDVVVNNLLVGLRAEEIDGADVGDTLMLDYEFSNATDRDIERAFGKQFVEELLATPVGDWQGPLTSGFGAHLVKLDSRVEGQIPALAEVRDEVFRDWGVQKREQTNAAFYSALRERYTVTIPPSYSAESAQNPDSGM